MSHAGNIQVLQSHLGAVDILNQSPTDHRGNNMVIQCENCGHKSTRRNFLATHKCEVNLVRKLKRKRKPEEKTYSDYMLCGVHLVS